MTTSPFHILLISRFLALRRLAVCVGGIVLRCDIAKISHDIHHLVVAEQADHSPHCLWRFLFQGDQKIHYLAWLRASIQEITDLNQGSLIAGPVMLCINEPGPLKNGHEVIKVTVNVRDGDDAFRFICRSLGRSRPCYANQHKEEQAENANTAMVREG